MNSVGTIGQTTYGHSTIKAPTRFEDFLTVHEESQTPYQRDTNRIVLEFTDEQYRSMIELAYMGVFPPTPKMKQDYPDLVDDLIRIHGEPNTFEYEYMSAYIRDCVRKDAYNRGLEGGIGEDSIRGIGT